ncbi:hypothetical protein CRUP_009777 [Coryphaenoides rupestris]|nr:hypothetical protein CRUP_009777 [Coryphaenoides rupestris]
MGEIKCADAQSTMTMYTFAFLCAVGLLALQVPSITAAGECGENIFMATDKATWATAVQDWHSEVKNFRYGVGAVKGETVGHFTQVVWAMSYEIGCGIAHCPSHHLPYYYVCQYCPAGNYNVGHPYKTGPSCGDCPNYCDDKLCTNPCPYTDKYSNCPALAAALGCENEQIAPVCKASCQCKNKIH